VTMMEKEINHQIIIASLIMINFMLYDC